jgi:hypothetical protein
MANTAAASGPAVLIQLKAVIRGTTYINGVNKCRWITRPAVTAAETTRAALLERDNIDVPASR